jgi:membrane-bound serine protease (ClpP class)
VQLVGVVLLLASAAFFLLELKHPGLGIPTAGGVITLVVGGLVLFNPSVPNARVSPWVIAPVGLFAAWFFSFVVAAAIRVRRMPRKVDTDRLIGAEGVVTTALDPKGVIQIASERWSATSAQGPVPEGTRVRVVAAEGLKLTVEPVQSDERVPIGSGEE